MRKFVITCENEELIDKVIDELITPGKSPVPNSSVLLPHIKISDYYPASKVDVEVELTDEQLNELSKCKDILAISEVTDVKFGPYFRNQKRILSASYSSTDNSIPESWAMSRCISLSALPPWNQDFTYMSTGSSVDMIVLDGGIILNHPEWKDSDGNDRVQIVNWSNYAPLTAERNLSVTVSPGTSGEPHVYYINGVERDTVYVVKDREGTTGKGYPATTRVGVYDFNLDGITTQGHPFYIGSVVDVPFNSDYVSNNGATTGTVSLTVWPFNDSRAINAGGQNIMYYWCGNHSGMGGAIARTPYNTQSTADLFYSDAGGHGTHCSGSAAGSACGWATDSKIYHIKWTFYDSYGYQNVQTGVKTGYDFLIAWHKDKMLNPSLSSRPTVSTHSYGWPTGFNYIDVDLKFKELTDNGIHVVHASGNDNRLVVDPSFTSLFNSNRIPSPTYPAGYWTNQSDNPVIEVGSLGSWSSNNQPYTKADYSNYGTGVSIYAPGTYIQSAWHNTTYATYQGFPGFGLRKISGTSMATPNVAGILACMLDDNPGLTPLQAKQLLLDNAITGAVSSISVNGLNLYGSGVGPGGNPLTVSQYPATYVATTSSAKLVLKHLGRCYNRVTPLEPLAGFYAISGFNNGSVFYMSSATNMEFLDNCV